MPLFEQKFTISAEDTRGFVRKSVNIPAGVEDIEIVLRYDPEYEQGNGAEGQVRSAMDRYLQEVQPSSWLSSEAIDRWQAYSEHLIPIFVPLRNQLTMGIYAPDGQYWGRWDAKKFFGQPAILGSHSVPGLRRGALSPGEWTFEIENFGVFSAEVEAQLTIKVVAVHQEERWWRGETHSHTVHSDGELLTTELFSQAAAKELDFLVLSDHNTISGWDEVTGREPLLVIKGEELTTFFGHAVAAGYPGYLDWRSISAASAPNEQAKAVRAKGGLFTIAHPFMIGEPLCCGCRWQYTNMDFSLVDAVEIWSGSWRKKAIFNSRALQWWDELLCSGHQIVGVAARDLHEAGEWDETDSADTVVAARLLEPATILAAIRRGRVAVGPKGCIDFSVVTAAEDHAVMGETICNGSGPWQLVVEIESLPEKGILEVVRDGSIVKEMAVPAGNSGLTLSLDRPQKYLRLQVWDEGRRHPQLFSNPVYAHD